MPDVRVDLGTTCIGSGHATKGATAPSHVHCIAPFFSSALHMKKGLYAEIFDKILNRCMFIYEANPPPLPPFSVSQIPAFLNGIQ